VTVRWFWASTLAVLVGGCNPAGGVNGVWVFYVHTDSTSTAAEDCSENVTGWACPAGAEPTDTSPWTYEDSTESSDQILVGEIMGGEGKDVFLVMGDTIVPGTIQGGIATFSWPSTADATESRTHEAGYHYEYVQSSVTDNTLVLDVHGQIGTIAASASQSQTWTETDTWDSFDVGLFEGDIPFSSYLEQDSDTYYGGNYYNTSDEAECQGGDCELTITQTSDTSLTFTATRTDYDVADGGNAILAGAPE
jgi:hypothetical protein